MSQVDMYSDSDHRYKSDPTFHHIVNALVHVAVQEGYTPGELKQVAFFAALVVERNYCKPVGIVHPRGFNIEDDK